MMSTLQTTILKHPDSALNQITFTSGGNVGIGGSPSGSAASYNGGLLHITQSTSSRGSQLRLTNNHTGHGAGDGSFIAAWVDSGLYITNQESEGIHFSSGGFERAVITNSGHVGVNNSNPRGLIHVGTDLASGATDAAAINLKQTGTNETTGIYLERSGERKGYAIYVGGSQDSLNFQRNNAGTKSDVLTLDRDGNVGVGTTSFGSGGGQGTGKVFQINGSLYVYEGNNSGSHGGAVCFGINTDRSPMAQIKGHLTNMPGIIQQGELGFSTRPTTTGGASSNLTERMRIKADGEIIFQAKAASGAIHIGGGTVNSIFRTGTGMTGIHFSTNSLLPTGSTGFVNDNNNTLGSGAHRWGVIFSGTGTINTSDVNSKQDIDDLNAAELSVATAIKGLIKKFRFIDAVATKGDDARIHVGVIAQEVEQAFIDAELDPRRYGLFCEDELQDGSKRLGVRYNELLAFVIAAI